jgi:hypothetical protein
MEDITMEIEERVIEKIRMRREAGRKKYGVSMERDDLTRVQWLRHAQEEAMDLAVYLEKCIAEEGRVPQAAAAGLPDGSNVLGRCVCSDEWTHQRLRDGVWECLGCGRKALA